MITSFFLIIALVAVIVALITTTITPLLSRILGLTALFLVVIVLLFPNL